MDFHWNGEITLGNVITMAMIVGGALWGWRDHDWRIRNLESWKQSHLHTKVQEIQNMTMLRENVTRLIALQEAAERRLVMLEDQQQEWRQRLQ